MHLKLPSQSLPGQEGTPLPLVSCLVAALEIMF